MWQRPFTPLCTFSMSKADTPPGKMETIASGHSSDGTNARMSDAEIEVTLNKMFDLPKDASDRQKQTVQNAKDEILVCMIRPDIAQFLNTKYGFINAVSDYVGHSAPIRETKNWQENRWGTIISGAPLLDRAMALMSA